jgi:DNA-binding CsgD family transcriptional regulator
MTPGRVYTYEELDGIGELERDAFRQDFIRAAGFEHFLIFRVVEPSGCNIWVTVTRAAAEARFSPDDRELCARLALHLSPALACHAALLRIDFEKRAYQRAADMLAFGVITLDHAGNVVSIDAAAERRLRQSEELYVWRDRLRARTGDARLQAAIRKALTAPDTHSCHVGEATDLLIMPVERRVDASIGTPRLLVYLSGRDYQRRDASRHLASLFDLSETQARLAMLLANGRTLSASADALGITEQTARTYSKQIYQRTGTCRQGELIQRILTSVAMLD